MAWRDRGAAGYPSGAERGFAAGAPAYPQQGQAQQPQPGGSGSNIVVVRDKYGQQRRIKCYDEPHLLGIERMQLKRHAQNLLEALGPQRCSQPVPEEREDIVGWILAVQELVMPPAANPRMAARSASPFRPPQASMQGRSPDVMGFSREEAMGLSPQRMRPQQQQSRGFVLEEQHSKNAEMLARAEPRLADAILQEVNAGMQKFHDGSYGGEVWGAQRALAKDVYNQLHTDRNGSFLAYKDRFLNFSVVCGNIGYSGNIPAFRYKVGYPSRFANIFATAYVTVFFTLKEDEVRRLLH